MVKRQLLVLLLFLIMWVISCGSKDDYTGKYRLNEGTCTHENIMLKKVAGFGNKYYLIYIYKNGEDPEQGDEFLGVIDKNKISVDSSTITVTSKGLRVRARDKYCTYIR